jgi:hypothetical protein
MLRTMNEYVEGDAKYLVYKQEEMTNWVESNLAVAQTIPAALDDAVVIRLKDSYAASALHAYANAILTVLDIMGDDMDPAVHQQQVEIADYFAQKAMESEGIKTRRLPD